MVGIARRKAQFAIPCCIPIDVCSQQPPEPHRELNTYAELNLKNATHIAAQLSELVPSVRFPPTSHTER